jgi:hypothetical protein
MMLVVKRRLLLFLWVSTCSVRVVSVTSSQCAQSRCVGGWESWYCRRMQAHPARVPVCNAILVNAFGDASRLDPSWPSNDWEGMLICSTSSTPHRPLLSFIVKMHAIDNFLFSRSY